MSKRDEMLLFRYSSALERGDFETVAVVLREAEHNPALEEMILEMNAVYAAEQTERFNHTNHKEIPMLAPLYQKQSQSNNRSQSLLLIAAIALVAVISVTLIPRLPTNTLFNSGQDGSPGGAIAQIDPSECKQIQSTEEGRIKIYSRPSADAPFAYDAYTSLYIPESNISQLDAAEANGETWYYVRIYSIYRDTMQGWMRAEEFNRHVQCAPLINPTVMARAQDTILSLTATATPMPFVWTEPTAVPPDVQGLSTFTPEPFFPQATLVPADAQLFATATPIPFNPPDTTTFPGTNVPFLNEATALPPTIVPPDGWLPTPIPGAGNAAPEFPVYFVEAGDTLLSILMKFGFDASAMRDISVINQLPEDAVLTPGQAILIPYNMPDLVTTCTVVQGETLAVWAQPAGEENTIVTTLPGGTTLEITGESQEADGLWVSVAAQMGSVSIGGAWVRVDTLDFVTDCRTDFVATFSADAVMATPVPVDPLAVAANMPDGYGCVVTTKNVVNIQDEPASVSPVREQLPAGTAVAILAISHQPDGEWYLVNYRSRMGSMMWGLIAAEMIDVPDDCAYWGKEGVNVPFEVLPVVTATPVPSLTPTPAQ